MAVKGLTFNEKHKKWSISKKITNTLSMQVVLYITLKMLGFDIVAGASLQNKGYIVLVQHPQSNLTLGLYTNMVET